MKKIEFKFLFALLILNMLFNKTYSQTLNFDRAWATYFGDQDLKWGDNAIDSEGNIYFVGAVLDGSVFVSTAGSQQPLYGGGDSDGFIVKLNAQGDLVWATYFGGELTDYITGIDIDDLNNIYIIGHTNSPTGIASPNSFQPLMDGVSDIFVAKFSGEGVKEWATYYPDTDNPEFQLEVHIHQYVSDIIADNLGHLYFYNRTISPDAATIGTFQTEIGQDSNTLLSKFTTGGERVWATYYGINGSKVCSIASGQDGLYVVGRTIDCPPLYTENTYFGTPGSHQPQPANCVDIFITKFSMDGDRLWGTYYGNENVDHVFKNALLTDGDFVYFTGVSPSAENIATPGSYQENVDGLTSYLVKFNSLGVRQWGTFIGLNPENEYNATPYAMLAKDNLGNIYISGATEMQDHISTPTAFQGQKSGLDDIFLAIFNPAGELRYGTYYGGDNNEFVARPLVYNDSFYILGSTSSTENISTPGSFQPAYGGDPIAFNDTNIFIAKFDPVPLGINEVTSQVIKVYPNPNRGSCTVEAPQGYIRSISIFTVLGQEIQTVQKYRNKDQIKIEGMASGVYFIKVTLDDAETTTLKIVVD